MSVGIYKFTDGGRLTMSIEHYPLPPVYMRNDKECFLDPIRNSLILITPEEIVRQRVVSYLQDVIGAPKEMIKLEEPMTYFQKGAKGRADIIVYRKEDDGLYPVILVECKSPDVELTDEVFEQAVRYDQLITADVLVLTNGIRTEWYAWHEQEERYLLLSTTPTYTSLLENKPLEYDMSEPIVWERPSFETLSNHQTYQHFLDMGWIGEGTDISLQGFIMNLSGCLQDSGNLIIPGCYEGINVIRDGGIRYTRFGNVAGGSWTGEYRYVLIEDKDKNNQIISFAVLGQMQTKKDPVFGNSKGHSVLVVAIDDFEKSHNSLQLNLDLYTRKEGVSTFAIWHDGKLTNGKKGRAKNSDVITYIKENAPDLLDENEQIFLGRFTHSKSLLFSDDETKKFLGRIIKYALIRDEYRKKTS
jgi:hypothetical protein